MPTVPGSLRQHIAEAAQNRCEYCQTAQQISGAQMHIEHIKPLALGGETVLDNLCLACAWCNSYKGAKIEGVDLETTAMVPLYNPRHQKWVDHFFWEEDGITIKGKTPVGRATIDVLQMNNPYILPARRHWVEAGWHPPE